MQHVTDVFLPLVYKVLHRCVLGKSELCKVSDFSILFKLPLVAVIDVVDFFFVDEALDALVDLLFVGPKVQRNVVLLADVRALLIRVFLPAILVVLIYILSALLLRDATFECSYSLN